MTTVMKRPVRTKKRRRTWILILLFVLSVLLFSGAGFYFFHMKSHRKENGTGFEYMPMGFTERKIEDVESALKAIQDAADTVGIRNVKKEFSDCESDQVFENTYYRFHQQYKDIPVYGRDMIVSANKRGDALLLTGNYLNVSGIKTDPDLSEEQAKVIMEKLYEGSKMECQGLTIYSLFETEPALTWKFLLNTSDFMGHCFLSAETGEVVAMLPVASLSQPDLYLKDGSGNMASITAEGQTGSVDIDVYKENGSYMLLDTRRDIEVGRMKPEMWLGFWPTEMNSDEVETIRWENREKLQDYKNEIDSMANVQTVYGWYEEKLNHRSTDGEGKAKIYVFTNWGKYNSDEGKESLTDNAMSYSDIEGCCTGIVIGKKRENKRFMSAYLDAVAHEYTHAVIEFANGLVGAGEPGSIGEGYCDIFGEIIEYWEQGNCDWIMCPDEPTVSRNLAKPRLTDNPEGVGEDNWKDPDDLEKDHGNVHNNSTITSHAAYFMWKGIDGSDAFEALSMEELAQLYYETLYSMSADCTLSQFRTLLENTAYVMCQQGILTNKQRLCVSNAMFQVGVHPAIAPYNAAQDFELEVYDVNGDPYGDYTVSFIQAHPESDDSEPELAEDGEIIYTPEKEEPLEVSLPNGWDFCKVIITNDREPSEVYETYLNIVRGGSKKINIYTDLGLYELEDETENGMEDETSDGLEDEANGQTEDSGAIYDGDQLSVSGLLEERTFYPPGGYEVVTYMLRLDEPMKKPLYSDDMGYSGQMGEISEIQVMFSYDDAYVQDNLNNKHLEISGTVMFGHSSYHITTILLVDATASDSGWKGQTDGETADGSEDELKAEIGSGASQSLNIPENAVVFNNHSYYVYDVGTVVTWEAAKQYCESRGGYLATISNKQEDEFLFSYITSQGYSSVLFGLSDTGQGGVWSWVTREPLLYENWRSGEPNNQGGYEHYGQYYEKNTDGSWNDGSGLNCPFLCEWGSY